MSLWNRAQEFYVKTVENSKRGQEYLRAMGIQSGQVVKALGIGFADNSFPQSLDAEEKKEGKEIGLLGKKSNDAVFGDLTFPLYKEGEIAGFLGWFATQSRKKLAGDGEAFMNPQALEKNDEVIITDSPVLYTKFWELGFTQTICLPFTDKNQYLVKRLDASKVDTVYLVARKESAPLLKALENVKAEVKKCKGFKYNDKISQAAIDEALDTARTHKKAEPREQVKKTEKLKNGNLSLTFEDVTYFIQPLNLTSATLKCVVTAEIEEERFTDRLDLYLSMSRRAFAKACAEKFLYDHTEFESDLHKVITEVEKIRDSKIESEVFSQELTESDEEAAKQTLLNPNVLDEWVTDARQLGFVGEELNLKLGFLMAISRLLDKPLSVIIQSSAGSGKSHLLNVLCAITPPESLIFMSKLTASSLYYMPDLRHKLLCVDEAHGSEGSLYPLRTLQSNHKLVLGVPMKDAATGGTVTKQIQVKGPISYVESTTSDKLHPENASRALILNMDESPEQTMRILESQRNASQRGFQDRSEVLYKKWQNVQRLLSKFSRPVVIPFAHLLKFPLGPNARRDHQKLLSLIKAVSLLRIFQKSIENDDSGEFIAATLEDYETAFDLFVPLMGNPLDELSPRARSLLEILQNRDRVPFIRRELMEEHQLSHSYVHRAITELVNQEILAVEQTPQGQPNRYTLLDTFIPERNLSGLLPPEKLKSAFQEVQTSSPPHEITQAPTPVALKA